MSTGGVIAIVLGAVVLVFLAVNRGLVSSGVQVGIGPSGATSTRGIVAPQPSTNYGGYLAASTAPGVSSALNGALTGLGSGLASWFRPAPTSAPVVSQGANSASPSAAAQPVGVQTTNMPISGALVGPQITPISGLSYDATSGAAFGFGDLSAENAWTAADSLETPAYAS